MSVESWFQSYAENDDSILTLELNEVSLDFVSFNCGEELIKIAYMQQHPNDEYSLEYDGVDSFVKKLINTINTKLAGTNIAIRSFVDVLSLISELQFDEEEEDEDEAIMDEGNDEENNMEISSSYENMNMNMNMTWLEEHALKKKWTDTHRAQELELLLATTTNSNSIESDAMDNTTTTTPFPLPNSLGLGLGLGLFSATGSFNILISDLLDLMKSGSDYGFSAVALDDNIYSWRVRFSKWDGESNLAADMASLDDDFGYNFVEIQLTFSVGLHPFYPPLVVLIRPRFEGFILGRIATLKCLQLTHWNPVLGIKTILKEIKKDLETNGRVDLSSELNSRERYPDGSYSHLEHLLLKLGLVTELVPRVQLVSTLREAQAITSPTAAILSAGSCDAFISSGDVKRMKIDTSTSIDTNISSDASSRPANAAGGWKKGTGYGRGQTTTDWDVNQYLAAQAEKSRLQRSILTEISDEFDKIHVTSATAAAADGQCSSSSSGGSNGFFASISESTIGVSPLHLCRIVEESSLLPCLEQYLQNDSLLDIERNNQTFTLVFQLLASFARVPELQPLLLPLEGQSKSLHHLLGLMKKGLMVYARQSSKVKQETAFSKPSNIYQTFKQHLPISNVGKISINTSTTSTDPTDISDQIRVNEEGENLISLMLQTIGRIETVVVQMTESITSSVSVTSVPMDISISTVSLSSSSSKRGCDRSQHEIEDEYCKHMRERDLQYGESELLEAYHYNSVIAGQGMSATGSVKTRVRRLAKEIADLAHSLPLSWSSSVWARASEQRMDTMQAMISGPDSTPYYNGLFLFDIYFPERYPTEPPKVNLQTTGSGSVRFNPNLYNCGKVCLSLLGTWHGSASESWNENISTLHQVLVSIQSLILVPEPYFNEPGYESTLGTPEGTARSRAYNNGIEAATLQFGMIAHLTHLKPGFEDVVKAHFYFKKDDIKTQVEGWISNATSTSAVHARSLRSLLDKLTPLLDALAPPS